jgi:hypothetical protein
MYATKGDLLSLEIARGTDENIQCQFEFRFLVGYRFG